MQPKLISDQVSVRLQVEWAASVAKANPDMFLADQLTAEGFLRAGARSPEVYNVTKPGQPGAAQRLSLTCT